MPTAIDDDAQGMDAMDNLSRTDGESIVKPWRFYPFRTEWQRAIAHRFMKEVRGDGGLTQSASKK